jgi:hypothetical protein
MRYFGICVKLHAARSTLCNSPEPGREDAHPSDVAILRQAVIAAMGTAGWARAEADRARMLLSCVPARLELRRRA